MLRAALRRRAVSENSALVGEADVALAEEHAWTSRHAVVEDDHGREPPILQSDHDPAELNIWARVLLFNLHAPPLRVLYGGVAVHAGEVEVLSHVEPLSDARMKKKMSARNRMKAIVLIGEYPA
jgi:hypothetical protein